MKKANIIAGIIGMIFSGYAWFCTKSFKHFKNVPVGPEFWPGILSVILFSLCAILVITSLISLKKNGEGEKAPSINIFAKTEDGKNLRRMLLSILITVILAFLWKYIGFLLATPVAVFFLQYLLGNKKYGSMIIYAVVVTVVVFLVFKFLLGIDMPLGFMEYWFY